MTCDNRKEPALGADTFNLFHGETKDVPAGAPEKVGIWAGGAESIAQVSGTSSVQTGGRYARSRVFVGS
jgi:hypothetical protein